MTYEQFEKIFNMLIEQRDIGESFLNKLPYSISPAFFDNELVESLHITIDKLCESLFDPNLLQDINYFLYDYEFGWHFSVNYKEYNLKTTDDILEYFKEQYFSSPDDMPKDDTGC